MRLLPLAEGEIKEDPMVRVGKLQVAEEAKPFFTDAELAAQNCYPHRFRHTFADSWLAAGSNVDDLMNVAGWKSIAMPLRYPKGCSRG